MRADRTRVPPAGPLRRHWDGSATHGIDLANNKLTGRVIHYTDRDHFSTTGTWTPESAIGMWGLFEFNFLVGTSTEPSKAIYALPIPEDGTYQISLLYKPGKDRASNVPIVIAHADGTAEVTWDMRQGSNHGFAVEVGTYRFKAADTNTVTLSTAGTNGKVIADGVAFVKVEGNKAPGSDGPSVCRIAPRLFRWRGSDGRFSPGPFALPIPVPGLLTTVSAVFASGVPALYWFIFILYVQSGSF